MRGALRLRAVGCLVLTAGVGGSIHASARAEEPHHARPPAVTGNPAFDATAPPRAADPGRLLLRCRGSGDRRAEIYASAKDFQEGKQTFYLKRWNQAKPYTLYPLHGHFLDNGEAGIFMIHDGKGIAEPQPIVIDQTVNMGLMFLRTTGNGLRAVLNVYAEEDKTPVEEQELQDYACEWAIDPRPMTFNKAHVRTTPNTGAHPPSHWYRESDIKILSCTAGAQDEYTIELLGSTMWPAHLAFLLVRAPGAEQVGYNVHVLEGPGRLLIHAHSYPHRTRVQKIDTMEETETVIGGLLLHKTVKEYAGWVGLVGSAADPMNTSYSRDATLADYSGLGHAVIPPLPAACR